MKLIIIGGNAAGMSAASRARRNDSDIEILVFEKSGTVSYGACGLPYYISDDIKEASNLIAVPAEDFQSKRNIHVKLFHKVISFDARKKTVLFQDRQNNETREITYDKLIIASGASAVLPPIQGIDQKNVFSLRTFEDGKRIKEFCETEKPQSAAIIGAGYIGLEMAEAFTKRGMQVHVLEAAAQVLPNLDEDMSALVAEHMRQEGTKIYLGSMVTAISGKDKANKIHLADGREIDVDLVLLSVGIKPNVEFARKAGVQLGKTGAIEVNPRQQTNLRNVYAAGDCAESRCRVINKTTYVPLGTTANKQGKVAGDNASGGNLKFNGITTTSVVKVFNLEVASSGLGSQIAERLKIPFASVSIQSKTRAHYYPGPKNIHVKLLFDKASGRLLGGQIVGGEGVAKRIDVLATALYSNMTVQQLSELDLSYAPPFAPVWDAILVAANQALKEVRV